MPFIALSPATRKALKTCRPSGVKTGLPSAPMRGTPLVTSFEPTHEIWNGKSCSNGEVGLNCAPPATVEASASMATNNNGFCIEVQTVSEGRQRVKREASLPGAGPARQNLPHERPSVVSDFPLVASDRKS